MKNPPIRRREALRSLVVLSTSFAIPGAALGLVGCSKKPSCSDVTGLSPDELRTRNDIATYTEVAPDASKKCTLCAQFVPAPSANACGSCKVVKGPINPEGWCKLFVAKAGAPG
jgi:High potential iron-sulfur protein